MGGGSGPESASSLSGRQRDVEAVLAPFLEEALGQGLDPFGPTDADTGDWWWTGPQAAQLVEQAASREPMSGLRGLVEEQIRGTSPEAIEAEYREFMLPARKRFLEEEVLPTVREQYVGPGLYNSSARREAVSRATGEWADQTASEMGQYIYEERQAAREALPSLVQLEQALRYEPVQRASMLQNLRLQELGMRFEEFKRTQPEYSPVIDKALAYLNTQTQVMYEQPNSTQAGISGLATGAATGAAVGSIVPGIGTGIGAAIGGGVGLIGGLS